MAETAVSAAPHLRTFVDLRAFAADPETGQPVTGGGDAYLTRRRLLDMPEGPAQLAALDLDGGTGSVAALPADDFVLVLAGGLSISSGGRCISLGADEAAILPAGVALEWEAERGTKALVMTCHQGAPGADRPLRIDWTPELQPSSPPAAAVLIGETPTCRNHTEYASEKRVFTCGVWDSTPYSRRAITFAHAELMHLKKGSVTFTDEDGRNGTFHAGDIVLIRQGTQCAWHSETDVAKTFCIYRPAA